MSYRPFAIGALIASALATAGEVPETQVLTKEIRVESSDLQPGTSKWETRWVVFPEGCEYIRHDIELLDEFPELLPSDNRLIADTVQRDSSGRAISMGVSVGAYRSLIVMRGPARTTVRLSVVVSCEDQALEKLRKKFGVETLDFD
jgi:hypothetical protein